jgi:hypothetical protein
MVPLVVSVCVVDVNVLVVMVVDVLLEVELLVVVVVRPQVAQSTGHSACICTATSPKMPSLQIMSGNTPHTSIGSNLSKQHFPPLHGSAGVVAVDDVAVCDVFVVVVAVVAVVAVFEVVDVLVVGVVVTVLPPGVPPTHPQRARQRVSAIAGVVAHTSSAMLKHNT